MSFSTQINSIFQIILERLMKVSNRQFNVVVMAALGFNDLIKKRSIKIKDENFIS